MTEGTGSLVTVTTTAEPTWLAPEREADAEKALEILTDSALEPIVDMVVLARDGAYEARSADGMVRFRRDGGGGYEVVARTVSKLCAPAIVVREAALAPADFDARFSARARLYRYTVVNRPVPDPFLWPTSWHVAEPLDLAALRLGCDPFVGEHDFASFCRRPRDGRATEPEAPPAPIRRRVLRFEIEATSFCHQMVRSIVGTLVDVGRGRKRAGDLTAILRARNRAAAGQMAPARGLCLWAVRY